MAYNIPLRVRNLIRKAGTADPWAIASILGVHIRLVKTPTHINGFWLRILRRKFIFVNQSLEEWQQKAVIGHELGHILLHPHYRYFCEAQRSYYCSRKHENEADAFAVELLKHSDIDPNFTALFLRDGWK